MCIIIMDTYGPSTATFTPLTDAQVERVRFSGDSTRTIAYHNRAMASVFGASEWAGLLELFQYFAPGDDEWEREWRIVQHRPVYSTPKTGSEAVAQVSPPQGWARHLNVWGCPNISDREMVAI